MTQHTQSKTETVEKKSPTNAKESTETTSSETSNELATNEEIQPGIWMRGNEQLGYFLTMGNKRLTNPFTFQREAIDECNNPSAGTIVNIINCVFDARIMSELNYIAEEQKKGEIHGINRG